MSWFQKLRVRRLFKKMSSAAMRGKVDLSDAYFKKAQRLTGPYGVPTEDFERELHYKALEHHHQSHFNEAVWFYKKIIQNIRDRRDPYNSGEFFLIEIAEIYVELGRDSEAEKYLQEALDAHLCVNINGQLVKSRFGKALTPYCALLMRQCRTNEIMGDAEEHFREFIAAITEGAYDHSSTDFEAFVALLIDKFGMSDPFLRDLAHLVRLHPDERRRVGICRAGGHRLDRLDLRSSTQIAMEDRKLSRPLCDKDSESAAQQLVKLIPDNEGTCLTAGVENEVRQLGEAINSNGGLQAMNDVWIRMDSLGGDSNLLSRLWNKVGNWR